MASGHNICKNINKRMIQPISLSIHIPTVTASSPILALSICQRPHPPLPVKLLTATRMERKSRNPNTVVMCTVMLLKLGSSESGRHISRDSSRKSPNPPKLASQGHSEEPRSTTSGESNENYSPAKMKTTNLPTFRLWYLRIIAIL